MQIRGQTSCGASRTPLTIISDTLLVTATLNCLGAIIQRRPAVANKIVSSILSFDPLKSAQSPMPPKSKVIIRSLERTARALFINIMKRYVSTLPGNTRPFRRLVSGRSHSLHRHPDNPMNGRIQQYLERMHRRRLEVLEEPNRKRAAPSEPTDGFDQPKRQRLGAGLSHADIFVPPLPQGPVSVKDLFTLGTNNAAVSFDVSAIPVDIVSKIIVPLLQSIDQIRLDHAINVGCFDILSRSLLFGFWCKRNLHVPVGRIYPYFVRSWACSLCKLTLVGCTTPISGASEASSARFGSRGSDNRPPHHGGGRRRIRTGLRAR